MIITFRVSKSLVESIGILSCLRGLGTIGHSPQTERHRADTSEETARDRDQRECRPGGDGDGGGEGRHVGCPKSGVEGRSGYAR